MDGCAGPVADAFADEDNHVRSAVVPYGRSGPDATSATARAPMQPPAIMPTKSPARKLSPMTPSLSTSSHNEPRKRRRGRRGAKPALFGDQPIPAAL